MYIFPVQRVCTFSGTMFARHSDTALYFDAPTRPLIPVIDIRSAYRRWLGSRPDREEMRTAWAIELKAAGWQRRLRETSKDGELPSPHPAPACCHHARAATDASMLSTRPAHFGV